MEANQLYGGGMKDGASDLGRSLFLDEAEMEGSFHSAPFGRSRGRAAMQYVGQRQQSETV